MIGAIVGDIAGSRFEWLNYKGKDFTLFTDACYVTWQHPALRPRTWQSNLKTLKLRKA